MSKFMPEALAGTLYVAALNELIACAEILHAFVTTASADHATLTREAHRNILVAIRAAGTHVLTDNAFADEPPCPQAQPVAASSDSDFAASTGIAL